MPWALAALMSVKRWLMCEWTPPSEMRPQKWIRDPCSLALLSESTIEGC